MVKDDQELLVRGRVQAWKLSSPELELIRREEIVNADTARAINALEGPFRAALLHQGLRPTSGLVRLQEIFKLLAGKHPPNTSSVA